MSADMHNTDNIHLFFDDCAQNSVEVLPPDINQSEYRFKPLNKQQVLYGLGAVKGTGLAAIELIEAARAQDGPFKDLFDFCARLDLRKVNRRVIESLIRAGAFDKLEHNRAALLAGVSLAMSAAEQNNSHAGQDSLFGDVVIQQHSLPEVPAWSAEQALQEEKGALGFYMSGHPYLAHKASLASFIKGTLADLVPQEQPKLIAGVLMGVRVRMTQRGKMAIVTLDDGVARVEVVVGAELLIQSGNLIKEDQLLVIEGRISHDDFTDGIRVSARKIYDLAGARSQFASLLKIACNGQSDAAKLSSILHPYRVSDGEAKRCPVKVEYHNDHGHVSLMLGDDWRVALHDDLIAQLEHWLSKDNVKIIYN
jgi:DNA polymerase-3 subunit alpha